MTTKKVSFEGLVPLSAPRVPKYSQIDFKAEGPFPCAHYEGGIALDQGFHHIALLPSIGRIFFDWQGVHFISNHKNKVMTLPFEEIQVCKKETVSYLWIFKAHRLVFYSLGEEIPFQSFLHRDRVYRMVHRYCEGLQDSSIVPEKSSRRRRTFYTSGSYPCAYQNGSWLDMGRLFLNDRGLHFMSNLRSTMISIPYDDMMGVVYASVMRVVHAVGVVVDVGTLWFRSQMYGQALINELDLVFGVMVAPVASGFKFKYSEDDLPTESMDTAEASRRQHRQNRIEKGVITCLHTCAVRLEAFYHCFAYHLYCSIRDLALAAATYSLEVSPDVVYFTSPTTGKIFSADMTTKYYRDHSAARSRKRTTCEGEALSTRESIGLFGEAAPKGTRLSRRRMVFKTSRALQFLNLLSTMSSDDVCDNRMTSAFFACAIMAAKDISTRFSFALALLEPESAYQLSQEMVNYFIEGLTEHQLNSVLIDSFDCARLPTNVMEVKTIIVSLALPPKRRRRVSRLNPLSTVRRGYSSIRKHKYKTDSVFVTRMRGMIRVKKEQLSAFEKNEYFVRLFDCVYGFLAREEYEGKQVKLTFNDIVNGPVAFNSNSAEFMIRKNEERRLLTPNLLMPDDTNKKNCFDHVEYAVDSHYCRVLNFMFSPLSGSVSESSEVILNSSGDGGCVSVWDRLAMFYSLKYPEIEELG